MSYLDQTEIEGEVQDIQDSGLRSGIGNEESSNLATNAYSNGSYFIYNNILYKAIANIAINDVITPNVNCSATTVTAELILYNSRINVLESTITSLTSRIENLEK